MHHKFLKHAVVNLTPEEKIEIENYIIFLLEAGLTKDYIAQSYLTIVKDTFTEELYFQKTGRYRFSSFAEAQEAVYDNKEYMHHYMVGLALSSFLWLNHAKIRRFFQKNLSLFSEKRGIYREVGPGHGMYFLEAMRNCNFKNYEGIDISPTSVEMTKKIVSSGFFGDFPNAKIIQSDFLKAENMQPADVLVMGEVLEHVENPGVFLKRSYETTSEDSIFFMTTCINAPAIDHLYNPGSVENLERLIADHKYIIQDRCIVPRDETTLEECHKKKLAINVAYLLVKS